MCLQTPCVYALGPVAQNFPKSNERNRALGLTAFFVSLQRIMGVKYSFPANLALSRECVDLISKVFQANPSNRISISGIRSHPWFLKNLPEELIDGGRAAQVRALPCYHCIFPFHGA